VENAFKHGTANVDDPAIEVIVVVDNKSDRLELKVMNNVSRRKKRADSDSGIGQVNVQRRLTLMYPDKHTISVKETDDFYTVNLIINL
jgi:two-component system LytT family sensor kinase